MQLRNLVATDLLSLFRIYFKQTEDSPFAQDDKFSFGHCTRTTAVHIRCWRAVRRPTLVPVPHQFCSIEFDAAKVGVRLVTATEGVKIALVKDRCGPMNF